MGEKEQKDVFWGGEEPLRGVSRNVHESVSLKLAGSFEAGFPPALMSPFPTLTALPSLPLPWVGWLTKGLDVHIPTPFTLKRWRSPLDLPLLCAFGLGCISSFPSMCLSLPLRSHFHDFANYILLLSYPLLALNSRKER